jgi:phosphoenolpyruvate carboxykinase (ATP)
VDEAENTGNVWWGTVNIKMDEDLFLRNRERAIDYLNSVEQVFVFDGYAGWHPDHRIKIRVISSRAYHALFMHNMLIRPTPEQLADFGAPDYVIYNSGVFPCNRLSKVQLLFLFQDAACVVTRLRRE